LCIWRSGAKYMTNPKVKLFDVECYVEFGTYPNGQRSIQLIDASDDYPYATASVCISHVELPAGHVAIKNYSENVGILEALVEAGIVTVTGVKISSGFASIPVVTLSEVYL
jgi:hypothetical protein